jgi:PAS domain S-box-containing protein
MVVEKNVATAELQRRRLEDAGYQVLTAPSGEEAFRAIKQHPIDLVLLDQPLAGRLSGLGFLTNLRALAPSLPVIMVSGSGTESTVIQALRGGVRDFLRKDIDYLEHLPEAVASVLARSRLEAQLTADGALPLRPVLLVEDDADAATLQAMRLERAGHEVLVARSATDALYIINSREIGLLVTDQRLDDGTGLELYRRARAAGYDLPAIVVSGLDDEATLIEALRAGVRDYIVKRDDYLAELEHAVQRVSERARLEAQLLESKSRLAGIVTSAIDAIILLDRQFRMTLFNRAAEQMFETTAPRVVGESITLFLPDLPERLAAAPVGAASAPVRYETRRTSSGGQERELEIAVSTLESAGRRFFSVIARDSTGRKQLERLLLQKDKLESLGLLAGGIAHDFNNLLVGIMGNASMALETLGANSPARGMLRDVISASETAASLTRQLLAYAGKGRFVIEPVDLSDLVRKISHLVESSIPKSIQLRLELADGLPCIEADAAQVQQVVMNLVINGAEAIGDKPGTLLITTGVQDVDENYIATALVPGEIAPGQYVDLQVHDTGAGMSRGTMDRIFDPFFTTKLTGRGLGLAAVLGIVSGHKGAIKAYSAPGQGTTFKVLFPATGQHVTKAAPAAAFQPRAGGETVLVADDEQIVRRAAKTMLERFGYTVVLAENGRECVDLYRVLGDKVKVIILDMTMPVMGGEDTFRELKAINPRVRVILSSGYNEVESIRHFTGKGLAGFIQKPYSALPLAAKVRAAIEVAVGGSSGAV